jgi:hypothetical protein
MKIFLMKMPVDHAQVLNFSDFFKNSAHPNVGQTSQNPINHLKTPRKTPLGIS